eukprot:7201638-Pyramimonas_sp.AAC.1
MKVYGGPPATQTSPSTRLAYTSLGGASGSNSRGYSYATVATGAQAVGVVSGSALTSSIPTPVAAWNPIGAGISIGSPSISNQASASAGATGFARNVSGSVANIGTG